MKNFKTIFIDEWDNGYWIFAVVVFLFDIVVPENMVNFEYKIIILVIALILGFILKLIFQIINMQESDFKYKGYNIGTGIYDGIELIKIQKDTRLQVDLILTLYDYSSSLACSVALIRIVEIDQNFAYGIKLLPDSKSLTEIIGMKYEENYILKSKINYNILNKF